MNTKTLISEAISLPVEERAILVDSLLKSLNLPESHFDKKWTEVAIRRLAELQSQQVKGIPADEVFSKILARFNK